MFQLSCTNVACRTGVESSLGPGSGERAVGSHDKSIRSSSTSLLGDVTGVFGGVAGVVWVVVVVLKEGCLHLGGSVTGLVWNFFGLFGSSMLFFLLFLLSP